MASPKRRKDHSPLDAKLQSLHEQQEKLRQLAEEHQRTIDDAPRVLKQQETDRRKEVMARDSLVFRKLKATATDSRAGLGGGSRSKPLRRQTRRERQEVRMRFFLLLVIFVCLVGWLIHMMS